MRTLHTVQEVIDELGGRKAVAELANVTRKAVHVWADTKEFPSKIYLLLQDALSKSGCRADESLFSFAAPSTEGEQHETAA